MFKIKNIDAKSFLIQMRVGVVKPPPPVFFNIVKYIEKTCNANICVMEKPASMRIISFGLKTMQLKGSTAPG
jgi:hypothetical protein